MSIKQPLNSYLSANLAGQSYFDCSNAAQLSFGGFAPYTFEAWVKPASVSGTTTIISRFDGGVQAEYALLIDNGTVQSYRNVGPWTVNSQATLVAGQWVHIATTYDGVTLSLYINGVLDSAMPFTSQPYCPDLATSIGMCLQGGTPAAFFQGEMYDVRVWNLCRSASDILSHMDNLDLTTDGLVASYAMWQMPAVDLSLNSLPITPCNNPGFVMETAGMVLDGNNYVNCGADTSLSFGGFAPYTFEGWINVGANTNGGVILSRFNGGVAAEYSFGIAQGGNVVSYRNVGPWQLASTTALGTNQWYHVATTYDGTVLSIYINGVLDTQTAFTSQPGFPDLNTLVGASYDQGNISNCFQGTIQNLRIWRFALQPDEIALAMTTPLNASYGVTANLDFSVAPMSDLAGKITLQPTPGAVIAEQVVPITSYLQPLFTIEPISAELRAAIDAPGTVGLSDDFVEKMVEHASAAIPASATAPERQAHVTAYRATLNEAIAKVTAAPESVGLHTVVEREGDNYHFQFYYDGVHQDTFSVQAPGIDDQTVWMFQFIATMLYGFFNIVLSVKFNTSVFMQIFKLMQRNPLVSKGIAACIATGGTLDSIIGVIRPMYSAGLLKMAVHMLVSWWMLVSVVWMAVTWLIPGYAVAKAGVDLTLLAIKLSLMIKNRPTAAATAPVLALAA